MSYFPCNKCKFAVQSKETMYSTKKNIKICNKINMLFVYYIIILLFVIYLYICLTRILNKELKKQKNFILDFLNITDLKNASLNCTMFYYIYGRVLSLTQAENIHFDTYAATKLVIKFDANLSEK